MNKRIKELAEQCFFTKDKYGLYWDENANADGIDLEKFAELIVQECILTIQKGITRDGNTTEKYLRSMEHIKHIRGRFGLCSLCGGKMFPGVAIKPRFRPQYTSQPAQPIRNRHDTLEIINVLKCSVCGASETNDNQAVDS